MNQELGTHNAFSIADPFSVMLLFSLLNLHFFMLSILFLTLTNVFAQ